jgi:uncharacterized protein (TIGR03435 family)
MSRAIAALFAIVSTALFGQLAEFEAASVRPHAAGVPGTYPPTGGVGTNDPERIVYNGFTLGALLLPAFGVNHSYRILGPDWLNGDQDRYDVAAIIPAGATKEQFSLMLQRLLVERFQIASHWEKKEVSGYGLLVGKNGPKMNASGSKENGIGGPQEGTAKSECSKLHVGKSPDVQVSASPKGVCFVAVQQPMSRLADFLDGTLTRPVADRTGLTGLYDFALFYSVEGTFMDRTLRPDSEGAPYVVTAVQEQLGLKLEPQKARIDVLVVDRVNKKPTEN